VGLFTDDQRAFLLTVARRLVPEAAALTPAAQAEFLDLVEDGLSMRSAAMQRQFSLFLSVVRWAPVVRFGRRLDLLDGERQDAALRWFQNAPVQLLRSGFWGMRTLVYLGYYGRPGAASLVAYRPSTRGNSFLHDR
jgi:hypothetical protein